MLLVTPCLLIAAVFASVEKPAPTTPGKPSKPHLFRIFKDELKLIEALESAREFYMKDISVTPDIKREVMKADFHKLHSLDSYKPLNDCIKPPVVTVPEAEAGEKKEVVAEAGKGKPDEAAKPKEQLDAMNSLIRDLRARCGSQFEAFSKDATKDIREAVIDEMVKAHLPKELKGSQLAEEFKKHKEYQYRMVKMEQLMQLEDYELGLIVLVFIGIIAIIVTLSYFCCCRRT